MERIKTLETRSLCDSAKNGGCGECQTSCQSACKTSCGVANQSARTPTSNQSQFSKSCRLFRRHFFCTRRTEEWYISIN